MAKLQLLIVDDEPVVRQGMESFLADYPDLCIIALAESVLDALAKLRQFSVDVILTETCLPDMDGPEAIRLFREEAPEAVVLIYSHNREEAAIFRGLKSSAPISTLELSNFICRTGRSVMMRWPNPRGSPIAKNRCSDCLPRVSRHGKLAKYSASVQKQSPNIAPPSSASWR
ncbi:MAG: response regulator transcription factor [Desulfuromonadales bacterium]